MGFNIIKVILDFILMRNRNKRNNKYSSKNIMIEKSRDKSKYILIILGVIILLLTIILLIDNNKKNRLTYKNIELKKELKNKDIEIDNLKKYYIKEINNKENEKDLIQKYYIEERNNIIKNNELKGKVVLYMDKVKETKDGGKIDKVSQIEESVECLNKKIPNNIYMDIINK